MHTLIAALALTQIYAAPAVRPGDGTAYGDVLSPARRVHARGSRCERAHETAHFLAEQYRPRHPGSNCFYIGAGAYIAVPEPPIRLSRVWVPGVLRGSRHALTFVVNGRHWEDRSLYVLDEAFAYLADNRVRLDDLARRIPNGGVGVEKPADALPEFAGYALCHALAVRRADPRRLESGPYRDALVRYLTESRHLYAESMLRAETATEAHADLLHALRTHPECEPHRRLLRELAGGAWLED